jgi:membrane fusion protein, heavy metal efflux system
MHGQRFHLVLRPRAALAIGSIVAVTAILAVPGVRGAVLGWLVGTVEVSRTAGASHKEELEFFEVNGTQSLRLPAKAVVGLDLRPVAAKRAFKGQALPPQIGTLNYDNDRLFVIRSRFPGELAKIRTVLDSDGSISPTRERPLRFGDKVKQGDLLAVIWSQQLGSAKAAMVDAISGLRLSQDNLRRHEELFRNGAMTLATLKADERQVQADSNTLLTAERSLKMWKLTGKEIDEIKAEAKIIHEQKKVRSADDEMKWARVEIRVPCFDERDPNKELVIVEKNTNINDMVDPINSPPLFKLADISRLQIWVHPHEEYLPLIRAGHQNNGTRFQWDIRFQAEPADMPPRMLDIVQIAPSLEPNQHSPMVLGYLPNPDGKYLIGQFLTATIFMPPEDNTVEIPTDALNEVEGQGIVFVERDVAKREYSLRRVSVVRRFKDVTFVRSELTEEERVLSRAEVARGRRPLQPLLPGERVITRGAVELTGAVDDLETKDRIARKKMADK